ncbi:MAG: peptide deformylase, partial [Aquiluna sp.]
MTVLPIRITGEPVLHQSASEVQEISAEVRELISDMFDTMDKAPGVGLAAPQVGIGLRIFVFDYEVEDTRFRDVA